MLKHFVLVIVGLCWLLCTSTANGQCVSVTIEVTPGEYMVGDPVPMQLSFTCTGPGSCSCPSLTLRLDSGCGQTLATMPVSPIPAGLTISFSTGVFLPDVPPGEYHICGVISCSGCISHCTTCCTCCPCSEETFTVVDQIDADINGDGVVDGIDLGLLLGNWSIPAGSPGCDGELPCAADLNGDTLVDGIDLGLLLDAWTL